MPIFRDKQPGYINKLSKSIFGARLVATKLIFMMLIFAILFSGCSSALEVIRGPYLQMQTSSSVIVRWRTNVATESVVHYGLSPSQQNHTVKVSGLATEHSVKVTGLVADTVYFYSIANQASVLEGGDTDYFFKTTPAPGSAKSTRIWVIGDSGTANSSAQAVRNAYRKFTDNHATDVWLMLGDNAYNKGTDKEYQNALFNSYPKLLQQVAVWPVLGNHDGRSSESATESGPYYDIFTLPRAGEAGGLASGTEAYYSFDYGNIHFIALDSFETDRSVKGVMLTWLENDLIANNNVWVIAFWHHPPYSKGSHDSDTELELIEMRQNALPILERYGVDLVLGGHSHSYERSMLINGHYGKSSTLRRAMILNSGSGRAEHKGGAYSKSGAIANANQGAVYAVAGSSGKIAGGDLNHPAMYVSLNRLGSMVIDVEGYRLDARFIDSNAVIGDYFSIIKTDDIKSPRILSVISNSSNSVTIEFSEPIEKNSAEQVTHYAIDQLVVINSATLQDDGRSVVLSTSNLSAVKIYTLTVNQVTDISLNSISQESQAVVSILN